MNSMVQSELLHPGRIMTEYIRHFGQYARVRVIFSGSYITRLIMGIGLIDTIRGTEKIIVQSTLGLKTMRLMIMSPLEMGDGDGNAAEDSQPPL